jgi:D-sedoheptulose 7-phosphate isomerase
MGILEYLRDVNAGFTPFVANELNRTVSIIANSGTVFTCGNGGSSSTASHFTQDLLKACHKQSICMSDNTAFVLATANDLHFSKIFSSYLDLFAKPNDVLVCISGSGNSKNLIEAIWTARRIGMRTVSLTGFDGGKLHMISEVSIHTPINDMRKAESAHSTALHYIIDSLTRGDVHRRL